MAGIACEEEADARLVFGSDGTNDWQAEAGPFEEERFSTLPTENWTLLVQAVDQWVPAAKSILDAYAFLPRWRLDDLMVSVSATGGGVGPHFDAYDVFLVQASGSRRWRIGPQCDGSTDLRDQDDLRLLQDFQSEDEYVLQPGDALYVPAGISHWGTALSDDCMTYSVGFRAPTRWELLRQAVERLEQSDRHPTRYVDTLSAIDVDPFLINDSAVDAVVQLTGLDLRDAGREAIADALGIEATIPRHPELIEPDDESAPFTTDGESMVASVHPAARVAYRIVPREGRAVLYLNGESYEMSQALAVALCHGTVLDPVSLSDDEQQLLQDFSEEGVFVIAGTD